MRKATALVALAIAIAITLHTAAPTAGATTPQRITVNCSPGVPEKDCPTATYVYQFVVSHNFTPPTNLKGGGRFEDKFGLLPAGGDYLEYRLYQLPGSPERLVIDRSNPDGNSWFTGDHYASFVQFYLTL
jgi:guanyl-specific ribonuclease Sa